MQGSSRVVDMGWQPIRLGKSQISGRIRSTSWIALDRLAYGEENSRQVLSHSHSLEKYCEELVRELLRIS
jgi:hypothetical protein